MAGINRLSDNPGYGTNPNVTLGGLIFKSKYGDVKTQCFDQTRQTIRNYLSTINDGIFVEIGVFGGASLLGSYDLCVKNNIDIYGIDPFETIEIFNGQTADETIDNVRSTSLKNAIDRKEKLQGIIDEHQLNIKILVDTSWNVCSTFTDNSIDCLHVDGDHSYNGVKQDLDLFWSKMRIGGVIINDDYDWGSCRRAIDEFVAEHEEEISWVKTAESNRKHIICKKL